MTPSEQEQRSRNTPVMQSTFMPIVVAPEIAPQEVQSIPEPEKPSASVIPVPKKKPVCQVDQKLQFSCPF
jgi:hypothetical protein